ncbi:putative lipid desaturase ADS3.2, chloroplastic, partial [Cucurbita argyrosperma subsp. sororia]
MSRLLFSYGASQFSTDPFQIPPLTIPAREIHRPRLPIIRLTPIPRDPLPLNYVGRCDFKALRLNSAIQIQNRAIPPPAEAFESQSPTPPTPLAAADGRRILLSDVVVRRQREVFWGRKWTSLDIGTAGVVVATHLLTLFAPFQFNWAAFGLRFLCTLPPVFFSA